MGALRVLLLALLAAAAPLGALAQCPFQKLGTPPPGHPDVVTHASPADAAYVSTGRIFPLLLRTVSPYDKRTG